MIKLLYMCIFRPGYSPWQYNTSYKYKPGVIPEASTTAHGTTIITRTLTIFYSHFTCGVPNFTPPSPKSPRIMQYYTDYKYKPVRVIAEASTTGHGTNIIAGVGVGLEATALPVLVMSGALVASYWLGNSSGGCGWVGVCVLCVGGCLMGGEVAHWWRPTGQANVQARGCIWRGVEGLY